MKSESCVDSKEKNFFASYAADMDKWGAEGPYAQQGGQNRFDLSVTDSPVHLGGSRPATEQRARERGVHASGLTADGRPATTNSPGK